MAWILMLQPRALAQPPMSIAGYGSRAEAEAAGHEAMKGTMVWTGFSVAPLPSPGPMAATATPADNRPALATMTILSLLAFELKQTNALDIDRLIDAIESHVAMMRADGDKDGLADFIHTLSVQLSAVTAMKPEPDEAPNSQL